MRDSTCLEQSFHRPRVRHDFRQTAKLQTSIHRRTSNNGDDAPDVCFWPSADSSAGAAGVRITVGVVVQRLRRGRRGLRQRLRIEADDSGHVVGERTGDVGRALGRDEAGGAGSGVGAERGQPRRKGTMGFLTRFAR